MFWIAGFILEVCDVEFGSAHFFDVIPFEKNIVLCVPSNNYQNLCQNSADSATIQMFTFLKILTTLNMFGTLSNNFWQIWASLDKIRRVCQFKNLDFRKLMTLQEQCSTLQQNDKPKKRVLQALALRAGMKIFELCKEWYNSGVVHVWLLIIVLNYFSGRICHKKVCVLKMDILQTL